MYDEYTVSATGGDSLILDITVADRIGLDGSSVEHAEIIADGDLRLWLSDGRIISAGRAVTKTHLCGLAHT